MHPVAYIELVSALACLVAIVFLIRGWKRSTFLPAVQILLLVLLILMMFYGVSLFLEWSGLGERFRWHFIEDLTSVFIPLIWSFAFYAFIKNAVEEDLRTSRAHYRRLVESTNDWIWEVDAAGRYTYSSPQVEQILGYGPDEIIGKTPFDLMPPEEASRVSAIFNGFIEKQEPFQNLESTNLHKNSSNVILETNASPIFDRRGTLIGYHGIDRDITRRKQAERETAKQQAELDSIFAASPVGISLIHDRRLIRGNARLYEITGCSEDELIGKDARRFYMTEQEYLDVGAKYNEALENGFARVETRWVRKEQTVIDIVLYIAPVDPKDNDTAFVVVMQDITALKAARREAEIEKTRAQLYLDVADVMIVVVGADQRVKLINKKGCEILEYSVEQVVGLDWFSKFLPASYRAIARNAFDRMIGGDEKSVEYFENPVLTHSGDEKLIAWHNSVLRDSAGKIIGVISSGEDITEARAVERARRENEERLRVALSAANMGTWRYVPAYDRFTRSASLNALLGLVSAESTQSIEDFYNYIHPEDRNTAREELERSISQNDMYFARFRIVQPGTSRVRWVLNQGKPFYDFNGKLDYVTGVMVDVSERQEAENALRENERFLQVVFNGIQDGISVLDTDMTILRVNRWMEEMYADEKPLVGRKCYEVYQQRHRPCEVCPTTQTIQDGQVHTEIVAYKAQGKTLGWIELSSFPIKDGQGRVTGIIEHVKDITERVRNQQALQESEAALQKAQHVAKMGSYELDLKTNIFTMSEELRTILGYGLDEQVTLDMIMERPIPEDRPLIAQSIKRALTTGWSEQDLRYQAQDGQIHCMYTQGETSTDEQGRPVSLFGIAYDITDRKQAEAALAESEEKYRKIFESGGQGFFLMTEVFLECNDRVCEIWACSREDVIGHSPLDFSPDVQPDGMRSAEKAQILIENALGGTPQHFYWQHRRKDGALIDCDITLDSVTLKDKKILLATMVDITEKKRAETALAESQQRFRNIVESSPMGIHTYSLEADGRLVLTGANPASAKILGRDFTDKIGRTIEEVYPPLAKSPIPDAYRRICRQGGIYQEENFEYHDDFVSGFYTITAFQTSPGSMATLFIDVTDRIMAEQVLRFTQFAIDHTSEEVYWINEKGRFVYVNDAACEVLGYSRDELLKMMVSDIDPDFSADIWPGHWKELKKKHTMRFESRHKTKDGRIFPVEITANYLIYEDVEYNCAFARDISERKAAEQTREILMQQLQDRSNELQSIVFTAAHDLRSPLVNIDGFTTELEKGLKHLAELIHAQSLNEQTAKRINYLFEADMAESLRFIKSGSHQMGMLLDGLMRLSRVGSAPLSVSILNMKELLDTAIEGLQYHINEYNVTIHVQPNLPHCMGDAILLGQVMTNLLDNAIKYRHPDRAVVIDVSGSVADNTAEYNISDNGVGIEPEHLEKVFELFHRLGDRKEESGQGVGLTIVRRILDRLNGNVKIDSTPNIGTTVHVRLPMT